MKEPRVIESVTNECQSLGRAHESSSARAEQLIACLEGEIAKRDARIVELEADLTGTQSRVLSIQNQWRKLDAELAAIKAQEPVAIEFRQFMTDVVTGAGLLSCGKQSKGLAAELSANAYKYMLVAPVSEAKAQGVRFCNKCGYHGPMETHNRPGDGVVCDYMSRAYTAPVAKPQVVMPSVDQAMRAVLREMGSSTHVRGTSNWCADVGRAVLDEVARLNAAPVQHPDDAAVDRFAVAMKAKLAASREKGRHGWQNATGQHLSSLLHEHMYKGDPLDVGNLAMMLHQNGQAIELPHDARRVTTPVQQVSVPDGWKLVPVNATEAILDVLYSNGMDESDSLLQDIWSAMLAAAPAAPAADAGLVEALDYQVLFDAIAAATSVYANGAVNISVQAFRDALAAHRAKGVV